MIGRQISHFYIIRTLGTGGMGVVYEAQDTRLPRSVAIKVLRDELALEPDALSRFKREARLASSLNHPNICTILEVGDDDAPAFIAMELLEGISLKSRLLGGPLSSDEILRIASQIADGLSAAHREGIVHRDITPGNIFLTNGGLAKLLDFGLAKHFSAGTDDGRVTDSLTHPGTVAGTIHYMAPEQLVGDAFIDNRCDLFALGAVLYHMATGTPPFDMQPRSALSAAIRTQPHIPIRRLAPHHSARLEHLIDTLLAKAPDARYQSAAHVRVALDSMHGHAPVASLTLDTTPAVRSVAILPFDIIGEPAPATTAFSEGLMADLAGHVSRLEAIRVAPRTSTRAVSGQSVREIGKRLDVELVLEGTVQRTAERVRVIASLIVAEREHALSPAMVVNRTLDEVLTAQEEVARELSRGIAAVLSQAPRRHDVHDTEAYHAFKRGQHLWRSCFEGGWRPAIEHFQHAIERDSQFALAHVALASAYNFLGFYSLAKPSLAFAVAGRAAERALAIDPDLASAFIEVGLARFGGDWDWDGAEESFRQGLALDPTSAIAHVHYSWLLMLLGRDNAALTEAERGHTLAPSSRFVAAARAQTMYVGGRYDEAIRLCTETLQVAPDYVFAVHIRGLCHLAKSMRDEAVADLEHAATLGRRAPFYLGILGRCYGEFGMRDKALALVTELGEQPPDTYVPPQCYVFIHAGLGERDQALRYQEQAYKDGASPFNYLTPCIRPLYARSADHKKRLEQMRLIL